MGHNPHPHGQKVMLPEHLNDHIMNQQGEVGLTKVGKLPDAHRETHRDEHPYPNSFNPVPKAGRGQPHGKRVEPDAFGGNKDAE